MVVTNTFSHTSDEPRFRAVLFTDEPMTAEAYGLIYNSIADKLEEAGYLVERVGKKLKTSNTPNSRPSGLDWSKSVPTSLFYFPCQAQSPDDSFFIEYMEGRYPLNPSTWIENSAIPLQPAFEPFDPLGNETSEVDRAAIELAVKLWRASQVQSGMVTTSFLCSRAPSNLQEWTTRKSK